MAAQVARYGSSNVSLTISPAQNNNYGHASGSHSGNQDGQFQNSYNNRPGFRFKQPQATHLLAAQRQQEELMMGDGPGRRLRKNVANVRRHVDYIATILNHVQSRSSVFSRRDRICQQPDVLYQNSPLPPAATPDVPVDCVLTKFVRAAMNKVKCPVYTLCWTPEGKRLITGASTGEFTLWNGTAFNFETILQAHDSAIRAMTWSHNEQWLISGDHDGYIKYWQPNMNNVHMYQAHKEEPIRGLSFSPTDVKLVSASDDGTARVFDFARYSEERILRGHGGEVRTVDWHPTKGLIVTGSRDSQQPCKLWDPKSGQCLTTFQEHKSSVLAVQWNRNGNWLLTGSRDHLLKVYDIRMMKELKTYRGHKKEVTSLAWHPVHESLFVSGGGDGSLAYWMVDAEKEIALLEHAHDQAVWTVAWHPLGHILSTGSNDNNTKFWARNRPGDTQEDIFGLASLSTNMVGALDKEPKSAQNIERKMEAEKAPLIIPGMGLDEDVVHSMNKDVNVKSNTINSGVLLIPEDLNTRQLASNIGAKRTLIKQPPAKRAQRQFERMWNVSKPSGGDDNTEDADVEAQQAFKPQRTSLLGPPPSTTTMLSSPVPRDAAPPPAPQASMPFRPLGPPQGAPLQWPPNMGGGPVIPGSFAPPPREEFPPPQAAAPLREESWKRPSASGDGGGDVDYRHLGGQQQMTSPTGGDVDLRTTTGGTAQWGQNGANSSLHDPRMRGGDSRNDIQEDIRDPRRRNMPQSSSPWADGGSSMQNMQGMSSLPPMNNYEGQEGRTSGGQYGRGEGRRDGGGPDRGRPFRGRGGPGFGGPSRGPRGRGRGRGRPY